jgi:hypothetical protein
MKEHRKYVLLSNTVVHICGTVSAAVVWAPLWSMHCEIVLSASYCAGYMCLKRKVLTFV